MNDDATLKARVVDTLEKCAGQLDEMAAQSESSAKPFAELEPLMADLKRLWAAVDDALKLLARAEQRTVRSPFDVRMRPVAQRLCDNLHAALVRDRQAGLVTLPVIADQTDGEMAGRVATRFAGAIARSDFTAAHTTLAEWLRPTWTPDRLEAAIAEDVRNTMSYYEGLKAAPVPGGYQVDANPCHLQELDAYTSGQLPAEITEQNFVTWCHVEIYTSEADGYLTNWDVYCSLYAAVVDTTGSEEIGYFRIGE